jgi:hypothetical protein
VISISSGSDEDILSFKQVIYEKAGRIENERPEFVEPVHDGTIRYQAKLSKDVLEKTWGKSVCTLYSTGYLQLGVY